MSKGVGIVETKFLTFGSESEPFVTADGGALPSVTIAYETYGKLNADRSNAVLICHALTGDQHVIGRHPVTGKPGWWELMVGPGKIIDTDRYFVICSNVLGGCMGSTGPRADDPSTITHPLVILFAADLEAALARVEKAGGKLLKPIFSFPGGRRLHFADPAGNELAIWSDK